MVTSTRERGRARAVAARTKSCTGLPSVRSQVAAGSAIRAGLCASRMVSVAARPGQTPFGPAAEPGEEVGLDEAGADAHVGLDVAGVEQRRRPRRPGPPRRAARRRPGAGGRGSGRRSRSPPARPSPSSVAARWVPVAHSSTTRSGPAPSRSSSASSGGRTVRLGIGPGDVGEDHRHLVAGPTSSASGGPDDRRGRGRARPPAPWSARPGRSVGSTTTASSGTSTSQVAAAVGEADAHQRRPLTRRRARGRRSAPATRSATGRSAR